MIQNRQCVPMRGQFKNGSVFTFRFKQSKNSPLLLDPKYGDKTSPRNAGTLFLAHNNTTEGFTVTTRLCSM
jgi:hypothetical protein